MRNIKTPIASHVNHVIVYTEYPELSSLQYFEDSPKVMMMTDWKDVLQTLQDIHSENASVAVYPNADIQRFEDNYKISHFRVGIFKTVSKNISNHFGQILITPGEKYYGYFFLFRFPSRSAGGERP
jgi:hypothetical protein